MTRDASCYHCGDSLPPGPGIFAAIGGSHRPMCCTGCKAVAEFIDTSGLGAFYDYRSSPLPEQAVKPRPGNWQNYDADDLQHRFVHRDGAVSEAVVEIGGMYCAACGWLLERTLGRLEGLVDAELGAANRRSVIRWQHDQLSFGELLAAIAAAGFNPTPVDSQQPHSADSNEYRGALKRLLVAAVAGMQVMMFAIALYAGEYLGIDADIAEFLRITSLLLSLPIVLYSARPFFASAWRGIRAGLPGMDVPVSLAIAAAFTASVIAVSAGTGHIYLDSVAMFVLFLSGARFLEMRARHHMENDATAMSRMLPDTVLRIAGEAAIVVSRDVLRAGDELRIMAGEVLAADGVILSGSLGVDESLLTGESLPLRRDVGDIVLAGAIACSGAATMKVTACGPNTRLAEIGRILDRAKADKPPIAALADRVARYFVVAVLLVAIGTAFFWYARDASRLFEIVLATLVVSCPCALALATPAAIAAATSRLAREGFLLVHTRLLEIMNRSTLVVFDKTGTLTQGRPTISRMTVFAAEPRRREELLAIAAAIETASEHVLARAFASHAPHAELTAYEVEVTPGAGVQARIDSTTYRIGALKFVAALGTAHPAVGDTDDASTFVYLGDATGVLARFDINDALRPDACETIRALKQMGLRTVIASGDREATVGRAATMLGADEWRSGLSPADKVALIQAWQEDGHTVLMIGDGVNDAPVLARADASVALDTGTALAKASADAVVLGAKLAPIVTALRMTAATRSVIQQNLAWAILYNATAIPLAVSGFLTPWMAAIGMSASSLFVVANALRLNRLRVPATFSVKRPSGFPVERRATS